RCLSQFFFFSSRRRHTRSKRDWSSDVCSSDLIVQGVGSGIMIPLMQTILFLVYPKDQRGYAMGLAGMVINVAPAVGPPISGVIIEYFEWRTLFLVALPIALLIFGMMYL